MRYLFLFCFIPVISFAVPAQTRKQLSDYCVRTGILPHGKNNAITDVNGVMVGQVTLIKADSKEGWWKRFRWIK